MTAYDSAPDTLEHISRVQHFMIDRAIANLENRALNHDESKLLEPEKSAFDSLTDKLANTTYGSPEYRASLRAIKPALEHHYAANDHHPEHWPNGVKDMSLLSLLEMLCDWRAASERMKQRMDDPEKVKTFASGMEHNKDRFDISDELYAILMNTARELDMV
jgi:hypothetical protein